ncbi:LuxR C-terminal-related transcriptional regulator [Citricoccus sp.]|uniref:helix-turn-helix transcriptional regulator n=2 Tax=Citricoccus sp. TaxID=1978372 RepID=UPI00260BEB7A|nr:LuxR C-terminal-related transcriptional regulator [Citricoccus sp.]HRO31666.1 LuxR C-terminal-related transcriptional regulator [Citricoccus sp.]
MLDGTGAVRDPDAFIDHLGALLEGPGAGRIAVLGGHDLPVSRLAGALPARVAGVEDLLLTVTEIQDLAAGWAPPLGVSPRSAARGEFSHARPGPPVSPEAVHAATGGWLGPTRVLCANPLATGASRRAILSPLLQWLAGIDPQGLIAQAAFLPEYTEQVLAAFHPHRTDPGPTLEQLVQLGLVVPSRHGPWCMPTLIRQVLAESVRQAREPGVTVARAAAVDALAAAGRIETAIKAALHGRAWDRATDLILEHWAELYYTDRPALARLTAELPRLVIGGMDVSAVVSQLLTTVVHGQGQKRWPAVEPDLARDKTGQRFRAATTRLSRDPDHRALVLGLIEVGYLRTAGHFTASARAAVRLRRALAAALTTHRIRPLLAGVSELQAGISLHLADRLQDAQAAYEQAYFWATQAGAPALQADAAAQLALVTAHLYDTGRARRWIGWAEEPLARNDREASTAERTLELARAHVAFTELDHEAVRTILPRLPAAPDRDEFWAAHAFLLALWWGYRDQTMQAEHRILDWRRDRPHAHHAALSERLLTEALHAVRFGTGHTGPVPGWEHSQLLANLEALRCLRAGDPDGALRALPLPERTIPRHRSLAMMIDVLARTGATPSTAPDTVLHQLAAIHADGGELADLAGFHALGWTPVFRRLGMINDTDAARLHAHARTLDGPDEPPALTPRERQVLHLLREGQTRHQMATTTFRSENTIKGQLRSLYAKLGASTAAQALDQARRYGL